MRSYGSAAVRLCAAAGVAGLLTLRPSSAPAQLPLEPPRDSGNSVTPAYEGWFQNADGTYALLVGYFNRNMKETLDIPIGPDNRIEPGGPDLGQPTHFLPRRQWGVFVIKVPADFGTKKYTWTIVSNGKTQSIPLGLQKGYQVEPYKDAAMGNEPPTIKLTPDGSVFKGPPMGPASVTLEATVGTPRELVSWVHDDAVEEPGEAPTGPNAPPPLSTAWTKYRGPGAVTFSEARPKIDKADGKATTTAIFDTPGEYILRVQANDSTGEGGGGFQCCWTNTYVKVNVK
ncbi:MAG: hypothetical protein LC791_06870 [Acidobacteria bacterium]|nr:hypothetical protein [Acidobacteriota bacterium]